MADEAVAWTIVEEYNTIFGVVVPDDRASFAKYLNGPGAMWLAYDGDEIAGCVVMRPLPELGPGACEVKRLYVRSSHRGAGIAGALMDALERHAGEARFDAVYLD